MAEGLKITITQEAVAAPVRSDIWCPAFVDHADHENVDDATMWVRRRLDEADPFEEYVDA